MSSEDAAGVASTEDVAELRRLLAAAQQSAEVSLRRANDASSRAGRWRDSRDELLTAARTALGMGPPPPQYMHTGPILARIAEVVAERDANVKAAEMLESLRATLRRERRSIAAREGAVERRVRAIERAAEERVARATAALSAAQAEARQQAAWTEAQLGALRAELAAAQTGGAVAAAKSEAKAELRRAQREAAQQVAAAQEQARAAKEEARPAPAPAVAPRQALIGLLRTGPAGITRHRARLEKWAETGSGPALEAARSMAAALEGGELTGSARMAAMTGLAGLLGGV